MPHNAETTARLPTAGLPVAEDATRIVDLTSALAGCTMAVSFVGWCLSLWTAYATRRHDNSSTLLVVLAPTCTLTIVSALLCSATLVRRYVRRKVDVATELLMHKMDTVARTYAGRAAVLPPPSPNGLPTKPAIDETVQAYLAGMMDRDE